MKKILCFILCAFLLCGCTGSSPAEVSGVREADFRRVDGSTVTIPLTRALVTDMCGVTGAALDDIVSHNTTHNAYVNLVDGTRDLVFATYPSQEELQYAAEQGVELEIVPVVMDAFVFLVNQANPVTNLTREQIVDIYSGKITNWAEVGGENEPIKAFQRPDNSGSQSGIRQWVMGSTPLMPAPTEMKPEMMGDLVEAVADYDNSRTALGYSYYYYTTDMYVREAVRLLSVDGVQPSPENIASKAYAYSMPYYAALRKDTPADSPARRILSYLLSDDGQKAAEGAKYVRMGE